MNLDLQQEINWQKVDNLLPVIVQEENTKEILMFAYMNQEALKLSLETKQAHYFSRTKNRLWKKGETSGHFQNIKNIQLDCDNDTLLIQIEQVGGLACHTGHKSCFYRDIDLSSEEHKLTENSEVKKQSSEIYGVVDTLFNTILERKQEGNSSKSYTAKLFAKGENSILKKVVEEAGELTFAVKDKNRDEVIYEASDLLYHSLVALAQAGVEPKDIRNEIKRRFGISGIEEKESRAK
jgi:phosphoribosyl-ATP pyrophosphohydrolase/phosphoribosyl-AMP cyclohydrolase